MCSRLSSQLSKVMLSRDAVQQSVVDSDSQQVLDSSYLLADSGIFHIESASGDLGMSMDL